VDTWVRTRHSVLFRLSDHSDLSVQAVFVDHSQVLLSAQGGVTYVGRGGERSGHGRDEVVRAGLVGVVRRVRYAEDIVGRLGGVQAR
jgi:hypothetical protein